MKVTPNTDKPAALAHIKLELVFGEGGKPENPGKNPRSKVRTNNKLNPHETKSMGMNPGNKGGRRALIHCVNHAPHVRDCHYYRISALE